MVYVNPRLRALLEATRGQPTLADIPIARARAQIVARTATRSPGPPVDEVLELEAEGPGGLIPVRVYRPARPGGLLVAFHGGGWMMGSRDSFDATCRHIAVESGLAVANVDYRLAPEHPFPAPIEDAIAATSWLAKHGPSLSLPSDRLVIL